MGNYRSRSGCLTCRQRRVKCDEERPVCGPCSKKSRDCQWESAHARFRGYRASHSSETTPGGIDEDRRDHDHPHHHAQDPDPDADRDDSRPELGLSNPSTSANVASPAASTSTSGGGVPLSLSLPPSRASAALPTSEPKPLSKDEAYLVGWYVEQLGRWLDGTDAARQFTLRVPVRAKHCPILLHAICSLAACHLGDAAAVDDAYERCITLLIERLNLGIAPYEDDLLCAIVILHFFEQLRVPSTAATENEQHLMGSSAILRASQTHTVDPSAPTLREAAFWIYVRQCLSKSTIDQQPPNIDFSLRLHPEPSSMHDHHPLAQLRLETAWANQIAWYCACILNFCFDRNQPQGRAHRMGLWQELWDQVAKWRRDRPLSFDPLWSGYADTGSTFPQMLFAADCHVVAFAYFHFSCILLLAYKPGPKFALRSVQGKLSAADSQMLEHAREICGSCKSSPSTVASLMILCHTIFIWGPLLSEAAERKEMLELLATFQRNHKWPTEWIIRALTTEWGMD